MSKILANQIANYLDNAPIEIKEGLNIPTGKPLQVNGATGTNGQVLTTDGTGLVWANAPYFSGNYNDLTNKPTIPAAQVNSDWNSSGGVTQILNKPIVPPTPSIITAPSPSGGGSLVYNSVNGEFTFTQPDLSSYLTVETDPVFLASPAGSITNTNKTNWNTAFGWGNHATQNYITLTNISASNVAASGGGSLSYNNSSGVFTFTPPDLSGYLTSEADTLATVTARGATTTANVTVNDMVVNGDLTVIGTTTSNNQSTLNVAATEIVINDGQTGTPALNGLLKIDRGDGTDTAIRWNEGTDTWEFTNDGATYNPIPTNTNQLTNGAGFLTSYTETDPVFGASVAAGITNTDTTNWNTAFSWGNHASAGYLTSEADTLDAVTARGSTTNNSISVGGLTVNGNLTVTGTQTVINTTTLKVSDNEITLNNDVTGTPTENAGIEVERGLSTNVRIRWDETSDRWTFTNNGTNYYNIPINISDLPNDSGYISGYTETDPIFSASTASSITSQDLTNWNLSYSWGDHSTQGYLTSETSHADVVIDGDFTSPGLMTTDGSGVYSITTNNSANWNTAYGWGNHAVQGYLTSETSHADVVVDGDFASAGIMATDGAGTYSIVLDNSTNWNTAFGWGDHSTQGYLTSETDPVFTASVAFGITNTNVTNWNTAYNWGNHATQGYLTSETSHADVVVDGDFASAGLMTTDGAGGYTVTTNNASNWDTAYSWGDHSTQGYLTSATTAPDVVVDGDFVSSGLMKRGASAGTYSIVTDNSSNWDTAYSWGNHGTQGYLTSLGSISGHTDVTITSPQTNQTLVYNGSQWVNSNSVASGLQSRTTAQASTGTINDGVAANITFTAAKSYSLLKIETSAAAWVTLYTDSNSRTNDASRSESTDPAPGSGVLAEVITTGSTTQIITPGVFGWNNDTVPTTTIYAKVVNKSGGANNITVTVTYVPLEI